MILVPIGHGEGTVRRLPWVTFALIAVCLGVHLTGTLDAPAAPEPLGVGVSDAWERWEAHTYLDIDPRLLDAVGAPSDPARRASLVANIRSQRRHDPPADPRALRAEQAELDRVTAQALGEPAPDAAAQPFARYGLTPAHPAPIAWLTHLFLHAGWAHLLGNLFLLFLAAPALEDRWGRPLFLGFYLVAGIAGAAAHVALTKQPDLPLVGASGAIAGAMGAFLVCHLRTPITFFYLFFLGLRPRTGTFDAPAWLMLPLWFAAQLATGALGLEQGVAVWAHVGGFAFGAAFAFALRTARVEDRVLAPRLEAKLVARGNAGVARALEARARGSLDEAWTLLEQERRARPHDPDVVQALWDLAVERDDAARGAPAMLGLVKRLAAAGDAAGAALRWRELAVHAPEQRAEARALLEIAALLRAEGDTAGAALALRHASESTTLGPALAVRVAEAARELDPKIALHAVRRALSSQDLPPPKRESLEALVATLERAPAASAEDPPWLRAHPATPETRSLGAEPAPAARVAVAACEALDERAVDLAAADGPDEGVAALELGVAPHEAHDADPTAVDLETEHALDFGASVAAALPRFAKLEVTEAAPRGLREGELALALLASGRAVTLALAKIQALALVEISAARAPCLVLDLALTWSALAEAGTLRVVRLRSGVDESRDGSAKALRRLAEELARRTGAAALTPSLQGGQTPQFPDLASYARDVLLVEG